MFQLVTDMAGTHVHRRRFNILDRYLSDHALHSQAFADVQRLDV